VLGVEDLGAFVDLQREADMLALDQRRHMGLQCGQHGVAGLLPDGVAAALGHAHVQVHETVVAAAAGGSAGSAAVGHRPVRRRVGQHARAAGRVDLGAGFVA
jgi:hypothetical protein